MEPRGIRNCNPGNIRITKDKWQGLREVQEDKEFNDKSKQELEEKIRQYNANLALEKDRLAQEKKQDSISNRFKQQEINIKRIQATKAVNSSKKHK